MRAEIDRRAIAALSAGHLATDFANGALPALLPFLVDRFDLCYTLVGALMLASALASSLDPAAVRALVGPAGRDLAAARSASRSPASASRSPPPRPAYWLVLLFVTISGLGVAAYHPEGLEVRGLRQREPARERDVAVLDRRQPRLRARADRRRRRSCSASGCAAACCSRVPVPASRRGSCCAVRRTCAGSRPSGQRARRAQGRTAAARSPSCSA